ncbi:MAG: hypothetical protein JO185_03075 [Acidobacteriaceae bacterium]|nr:hypothetical protein [Acidobacteriaceae bacterium]
MNNGVVSNPEPRPSESSGSSQWTPYYLPEVREKLERVFGWKVGPDDPSLMMMTGIEILFRQTLDHSLQWVEERTRTASAEYRQGLDATANEKKREVRQDLINLATIIHEKLKIEADVINKPLLARIEDLKQIASTIGANYAQFRWHDRIVGFLCGALLFLAAFASGMVFEMVRH